MTRRMKRWLFWTPRVLGILFALFVGMFALDVFAEGYGFWETFVALFMHLIPALLIVAALAISWRWEWVGGVTFSLLALAFLVLSRGEAPWIAYVFMCGPPLLIAALFLVNWIFRPEIREDA